MDQVYSDLITSENVVTSLDKIKNGKVAGNSGILLEGWIKCTAGFLHMLTDRPCACSVERTPRCCRSGKMLSLFFSTYTFVIT